MSDTVLIVIIFAVVALVAIGAWLVISNRRTEALRRQFGPEYERVVQETGSRRRAESELAERQHRVDHFHLHPLTPHERDRFLERWQSIQTGFVDDPRGAARQADQLIREVMSARGYPMGDFEQRSADISVDHPRVVQKYRAAREVAQRNDRGEASTEDLRRAFVYYRELFDELLEVVTPVNLDENYPRRA